MNIHINVAESSTTELRATAAAILAYVDFLCAKEGSKPTIIPAAPPAPPPPAATISLAAETPAVAEAPAAPAAAAATAPPPPPAAETAAAVDKTGLRWDARIHSSPPGVNKSDGKWRKKRNMDDTAYIAQVEAELRATAPAAPAAAATAPPPPPAAEPTAATAPPPPAPAAAATAPPPPPAAETAPPAPAAGNTFEAFMAWLGPAMSNGLVFDVVLEEVSAVGLSGLPDLNTPVGHGFLPTVWDKLKKRVGQ